ncbi:hypothetical protein CK203_066799 [Vitis vinifera]|uniref:Uncharacterized protein n=1 Tax=Vitis vinifera TaxID=29760 RepID=A0A438EV27_VITVI|nr:hypothetical protein CK203_066799 [Vitis vinifera]
MLDRGGRDKGNLGEIIWLLVSLWSPEILKKVGDECGGFITVDEQTKTMGELQWARILVRGRATLDRVSWKSKRRRRSTRYPYGGMSSGAKEVLADKQMVVIAVRLGMMGRVSRGLDQVGCIQRSPKPNNRSWAQSGVMHLLSPTANPKESRGLVAWPEEWSHGLEDESNTHVPEPFVARETEDMRKLNGVARISETDKALEEESMRYGMGMCSWGKGFWGPLISILLILIGLREGSFSIILGTGMRKLGLTIQCERLGTGQRAPDCDCPMKMKILSWNVRGANDSSKRKVIKTFIRNQRVDLICIQETKIQAMSDSIARSIGSGRFLDWKAVNAEGASGGILICWDRRSLDILDWEEGQFTLSCRFRNVENGLYGCLRECMVCSPKWKGMHYG